MLPALIARPGLLHAFAARGGPDGSARVVVSVWSDDDPTPLAGLFEPERDAAVADPAVELVAASVALAFAPPDGALIMRIFRGRAQQSRSAEYLEAVREGTLEDVAAGRGPIALFLGMIDDERFVTVSAWPDWQRIEAATGGNVRQPIATRHVDLLVEGSAEHLEIVPGTAVEPAADSRPARLLAAGA